MAKQTGNLSRSLTLSPEQGLSRYLQEIRKFPMLEKNEEFMLARKWQESEDTRSAEKMVTSHLRLVAKIAMGYRGYGLPMARTWSLVKLGTTAAQKKLFFNLRRIKGEIQALDEGDLKPHQVTEIADRLNVPEKDVISMNGRMSGSDASLNVPMGQDGDMEWMDWLADEEPNQAHEFEVKQEFDERMTLLQNAMSELNEREQHILTERRLSEEPKTLEQLSEVYNVSRERIRQIEVRAFEKLQKSMQKMAKEQGLPVGA